MRSVLQGGTRAEPQGGGGEEGAALLNHPHLPASSRSCPCLVPVPVCLPRILVLFCSLCSLCVFSSSLLFAFSFCCLSLLVFFSSSSPSLVLFSSALPLFFSSTRLIVFSPSRLPARILLLFFIHRCSAVATGPLLCWACSSQPCSSLFVPSLLFFSSLLFSELRASSLVCFLLLCFSSSSFLLVY